MSSSNCCFLTCIQISQEAGQVFPSLSEFSTVYCDPHSQKLWLSQWSRSRCFSGILLLFLWLNDVGNLISASSALSKSSLYICKFLVHTVLKPSLEDFEHYFASTVNECNHAVVWAFFGITFVSDWNENWPLPVLWPLLSFPNLLTYWVQHFHRTSFRIWNSSTGIPSPPLALFVVMLPKAHLTLHSRSLALSE